ncbi:MAG: MBL fold metallo-hydrolase, partial [Ilumatobacteraceae bacterium]
MRISNPVGAPGPDTIEITVLGRGYGESVVVHLGDDNWSIIDSFQGVGSEEPAPLRYLRSIGVDVAEQVSSVVLSHVHADHYFGIDRVVKACKRA